MRNGTEEKIIFLLSISLVYVISSKNIDFYLVRNTADCLQVLIQSLKSKSVKNLHVFCYFC